MEKIIPDGALKKESVQTGTDVKTDLRSINRPPKDKNGYSN
jgi:hypothetical protein